MVYDQVSISQVAGREDRYDLLRLLAFTAGEDGTPVRPWAGCTADETSTWLLARLDELPVGAARVGPLQGVEQPCEPVAGSPGNRHGEVALVDPVVLLPDPRARLRICASLLAASISWAYRTGFSRLGLSVHTLPSHADLGYCADVLGFRPASGARSSGGASARLELGLASGSRWLRYCRHFLLAEVDVRLLSEEQVEPGALPLASGTRRRPPRVHSRQVPCRQAGSPA